MPRTLKRRSDVLDDQAEDSSASRQPPRQRRRSSSSASSDSDGSSSESPDPQPEHSSSSLNTAIKKLVRLALSTEYSRTPLRRQDISQKVLSDTSHSRSFKQVFAGAQKILGDTFGTQLVELPSREKMSLKDRRTQAASRTATKETQTQGGQNGDTKASSASSSKSWILVSVLPKAYKTDPLIATPTLAPSAAAESTYTALYTFILSLIYLNAGALAENRLERYLKRVNLEAYTPLEISTEKLMARMLREGYVERRKDSSSGEEVVEWVVGPRGKVEVGEKGVVGLVKSVYGVQGGGPGRSRSAVGERRNGGEREEDEGAEAAAVGTKGDEEELDAKLRRTLGIADVDFPEPVAAGAGDGGGNAGLVQDQEPDTQPQRRGRPRRAVMNDDGDDD